MREKEIARTADKRRAEIEMEQKRLERAADQAPRESDAR